jgi:hypothetical protein
MTTWRMSRWRQWAVKLAQHASSVLPGAQSPWAEAMRRELDYIADDAAALRWAIGCVCASYRARLLQRPWFNPRTSWRQVAASGALMLLLALAVHDNAGGQTEPPRPAPDETMCDRPVASPDLRQDPSGSRPTDTGQRACRSDRPDPPAPTK